MSADIAPPPPPPFHPRRRPHRRTVVLVALAVVILLVAGAWLALDQGASGYYTFAPGTAPLLTTSSACRVSSSGALALPDGSPCARLVVPRGLTHPLHGEIFMVDVLVGPATAFEYLESKIGVLQTFHDGMRLLPAQQVLGPTPPSQLNCQGNEEMTQAREFAAVAALRRLGYSVATHYLGAQLALVEPGTPAARAGLHCGDVITAVDGRPVATAAALVSAVHSYHPGNRISLTVKRSASKGKARVLHLTAMLSGTPAEQGQPAKPRQAFLGVYATDQVSFTLPFHVTVEVGDIGGPSAGLAMTLGLLDVLSDGQLTGGHKVAATGTISPDGAVGPVGGVAEKTVAVRDAGAQYFFVPKQEYSKAESEARSMKVLPVTSLSQALEDLRKIGGRVPPSRGSG